MPLVCVDPFPLHENKNLKILQFFTQTEYPAPQEMKFRHKKKKIVLSIVILDFGYPILQLHQMTLFVFIKLKMPMVLSQLSCFDNGQQF